MMLLLIDLLMVVLLVLLRRMRLVILLVVLRLMEGDTLLGHLLGHSLARAGLLGVELLLRFGELVLEFLKVLVDLAH